MTRVSEKDARKRRPSEVLQSMRGSSKALLFLLLGLSATLLHGCATPASARYFEQDFTVQIDKKSYAVSYNWHCTQVVDGPNMGPGSLLYTKWEMHPGTSMVLKKLENDAVLLFRPTQYCGEFTNGQGKEYTPFVLLIDSAKNPRSMQYITEGTKHGLGQGISLRNGLIRRLENAAPDFEASDEERALKQVLQANSRGYHSVSARVLPESYWGKSDALRQYFKDAKGVLVAPISGDGSANWFPVNQSAIYPSPELDSYLVPLAPSEGAWKLLSYDDYGLPKIYFALSERRAEDIARPFDMHRPPLATVDYEGVRIELKGGQQIFDAKRRLLIQFLSSYQVLPWIGRD